MKKLIGFILISAFLAPVIGAQDLTSRFDANEMRDRVKRLSADDFEGRGPGTEGGKRAAQYIADQMKAAGIAPANKGSYFQNVPLVGMKVDPNTRLDISGKNGSESLKFGDDFVAMTGAQTATASVNADMVFVGYGIEAPLYEWNDYKGPTDDYKGKLLIMLVNDPPATSDE